MNEQAVLVTAPGSPFDGITIEKARIVNSAIGWRRVEVIGGKFSVTRRPTEYVFHRVVLPGHLVDDPFVQIGDMELWDWDGERERGGVGSRRTLSLDLVKSFRVLEAEELSSCSQCGVLLPTSRFVDAGPAYWGGHDERDYFSRYECERCWR